MKVLEGYFNSQWERTSVKCLAHIYFCGFYFFVLCIELSQNAKSEGLMLNS